MKTFFFVERYDPYIKAIGIFLRLLSCVIKGVHHFTEMVETKNTKILIFCPLQHSCNGVSVHWKG